MSTTTLSPKSTWSDRFSQPTAEQLLGDLPEDLAAVGRSLLDRLLEIEEVDADVRHLGLPWRWTVVLTHPADESRGFAYIVPDPVDPKVCLPLPREMITSLPARRVRKQIKSGVQRARVVGPLAWATWSLRDGVAVEDLADLARRKAAWMSPPAGQDESVEPGADAHRNKAAAV